MPRGLLSNALLPDFAFTPASRSNCQTLTSFSDSSSLSAPASKKAAAFLKLPTGTANASSSPRLPPSQSETDAQINQKLQGVEKDLADTGTSEEELLGTALGHKVIRNGLPQIDTRPHDSFNEGEMAEMGSKYPGGDLMAQSQWQKWRYFPKVCTPFQKDCTAVPPEEDWYAGARLGEYAKPLIMGENKVGYLNQAPVPLSQSEDILTLVSESGVSSRRARHAALYAKAAAGQADEFFRLARRRLRQVLRDPPLSVRPGADVYPLYSASVPTVLNLLPSPPPLHEQHSSAVSLPAQLRQGPSTDVLPKKTDTLRIHHADFL